MDSNNTDEENVEKGRTRGKLRIKNVPSCRGKSAYLPELGIWNVPSLRGTKQSMVSKNYKLQMSGESVGAFQYVGRPFEIRN